jgi:putative hemolysin
VKAVLAWFCACLIAALLGCLGPSLDDHGWEQSAAKEMEQAQHDADHRMQVEMRTARYCREKLGEASVVWRADGVPVCVPRRGKAVVAQVQ